LGVATPALVYTRVGAALYIDCRTKGEGGGLWRGIAA
jgi:hypothetical protein